MGYDAMLRILMQAMDALENIKEAHEIQCICVLTEQAREVKKLLEELDGERE